jgi:hypothetical protein
MSDDLSFSVLLPIYHGDNPETLETAIRSVISQTKSPDKLVISVMGR